MNELSEQELAERSGTTVPQLRRFVELGIIRPTDRIYQPSDIQRVRIVQALGRAGITSKQIGQLIAAGAYSMAWAGQLFPEPTPQVPTTLEQAVEQLQLPAHLVERLYASWELAMPEPRQPIRADDAELLGLAAVGYSAFGGDETVALSVARQLGESLRRLAESQMRLFRSRIEEPLIASDIGQPPSNSDAISAIAMPLLAALERTVLLLYHRHLEQQVLETIVLRRLPRARMGVSTGPVVFQDGDYFGRTVNLAARITDYARPGEVLVSDEVVTASNAPQGVRYRPIGSIVLKGIETPVTLHTAVRCETSLSAPTSPRAIEGPS